MNYFLHRRVRNTSILLLVLAALWWWVRAEHRALGSTEFATGYLLAGAIGFLALYNIRKKLPFLPLGSSATWLQGHLYVGMGTVGVFALHAGAALPHGVLDTLLASVYLLTVGSGIVGLYLTRAIPAQLARLGEEVVYERIPAHRHQLRQRAREVALESVAASGATTLADFYSARLLEFFDEPRSVGYLLRPSTTHRKALLGQMQDVRRYLSDPEQAPCEKLFALVRRKDDLDFQEARQRLLKTWLFVHIGLTYSLLLLAALHGLLAHAFHGGGL